MYYTSLVHWALKSIKLIMVKTQNSEIEFEDLFESYHPTPTDRTITLNMDVQGIMIMVILFLVS